MLPLTLDLVVADSSTGSAKSQLPMMSQPFLLLGPLLLNHSTHKTIGTSTICTKGMPLKLIAPSSGSKHPWQPR